MNIIKKINEHEKYLRKMDEIETSLSSYTTKKFKMNLFYFSLLCFVSSGFLVDLLIPNYLAFLMFCFCSISMIVHLFFIKINEEDLSKTIVKYIFFSFFVILIFAVIFSTMLSPFSRGLMEITGIGRQYVALVIGGSVFTLSSLYYLYFVKKTHCDDDEESISRTAYKINKIKNELESLDISMDELRYYELVSLDLNSKRTANLFHSKRSEKALELGYININQYEKSIIKNILKNKDNLILNL